MKKTFIYSYFLLLTALLFAQDPIQRNLGDFNSVYIYNGLEVQLQKSETSYIEISGSQASHVSVKNSNGKLKIRLKITKSIIPEDVQIILHYRHPIELLDANQGAVFISADTLQQDYIELKAQEGARISLIVQVQNLKVKSVTGAQIEVSGKATNQQVLARTGARYKALQLHAVGTFAKVSSGATISIKSSDLLDAKTSLGGTIYYKPPTQIIKSNKTLGGQLKIYQE